MLGAAEFQHRLKRELSSPILGYEEFLRQLEADYAQSPGAFFTDRDLRQFEGRRARGRDKRSTIPPEEANVSEQMDYFWWQKAVAKDPKRPVVPITFLYHCDTALMLSIQRPEDGHYYDFSTKRFVNEPLIPRASFTRLGALGDVVFLYGAVIGCSAGLHGNYIVTVRDQDRGSAIVALLSYAIANNRIDEAAIPRGLDGFRPERGLPAPQVVMTAPARAGRAVELD
jgi:hypothetical protein